MKTIWFVMAETEEGLFPIVTHSGKVAQFQSISEMERVVKEQNVIRWQAYVWVFPKEVTHERKQKGDVRATVPLKSDLQVSRDSIYLRRVVTPRGF